MRLNSNLPPPGMLDAARSYLSELDVPRMVADRGFMSMMILPLLSMLIEVLYLANLHSFHQPGLKLFALIVITSVCMAALGMLDARQVIADGNDSNAEHSPARWYALLLFWPVTLRVYLKQRVADDRPDYSPIGTVVSSVFVLSSLITYLCVSRPSYEPAPAAKPGTRLTIRTGKSAGSTPPAASQPKPADRL